MPPSPCARPVEEPLSRTELRPWSAAVPFLGLCLAALGWVPVAGLALACAGGAVAGLYLRRGRGARPRKRVAYVTLAVSVAMVAFTFI
ncbi:MAG: hypothetical protein IT371_13115 [Deltaproteobacteria bacterium]|nr:hypothetical protein [Deltaproteobacteria bacterium]